MANHGCINGQIDGTGYSSPVPVIGLYIAAASLLCMLLMLCDIVAGFRARKQWLPCKFFTLNSVTLTLFSVSAKLPLDLTTPMPSPSDQLSKLSGTTFICVSMCFLMPSLGVHPASESFTNMVALTIFVLTVFVNICVQLFTGVVALFLTEHIIILCSLLVVLLMMWQSYLEITNMKKICIEVNKEIFTKGNGSTFGRYITMDASVFQRLKRSYSYGYSTNSQLLAGLSWWNNAASLMICTLCCGTLIQAAYRSVIRKELEFCSGNSDYGWSMPLILTTQALTVIIGSSAVIFRLLTMSRYLTDTTFDDPVDKPVDDVIERNPILGITSRLGKYGKIVRYAFLSTMSLLEFLIGFLPFIISLSYWVLTVCLTNNKYEIKKKSEEDLKIWLSQNKSEPSSHFTQLLTAQNYPYHQFDAMKVIDPSLDVKDVPISSLSIVLLVRIAQLSLPENNSTPLVEAFNEAKQLFYYVEKNITPKNPENDNRLLFAKSVWAGQEFSCLLPEIFNTTTNTPIQSDLARAFSIIIQLRELHPSDPVLDVLVIIAAFIIRKNYYSTIQELITSVEQLFVDMVRVMLAQLPNAIYKSLSNSTDEEYEESVKLALKMTCKVESIAQHVQWSFPPGLNFTMLGDIEATPQVEAIAEHVQWSYPPGCNFTRSVDIEATPQVDAMSQV